MITLTLSEIAKALEITPPSKDFLIKGISIDSRTTTPNNLFIALPGEQFDGHDFIEDAIQKGALALLISKPIKTTHPTLIVPDTEKALGTLAALWRNRFSLPLIGVTGSNGKTTLKNMIASILYKAAGSKDQVLATEGNLNNHLGVPLMLARLNTAHRYAVIEMGMNHFGEIEYLTRLAKPTVAVINNAASAHTEYLGDVAGVAKAKGEIFLGLQPKGTAVLNRDDAFFDYWKSLTKEHTQLSFGLNPEADINTTFTQHNSVTLHTPKGNFILNLPLLGQHNIMNAMAATATALALDIPLPVIKEGLESIEPAKGRLQLHRLPNHVSLIDDTYNANPASTKVAIQTLASLEGKKILVLGDMRELGTEAKTLHAEIGHFAKKAGIDILFTLGDLSSEAARAFDQNAHPFSTHNDLIAALTPYLSTPCTILIKGSRGMRMEKIVAGLLPHYQCAH